MATINTIESHPDAKEGVVRSLGVYDTSTFVPGSVILCRNTAPLVAFAYSLIQRDVPCRILGRDIGAQLIDIVKKRRPINLDDLEAKLIVWRDREIERAIGQGASPERIEDQYACLTFFIQSLDDDSRTVADLLSKIELMFTDEMNGKASQRVTLSTVHKFKGQESDVVFILDFEKYMPSKWAKQEWQQTQERNLIYVAVTRSKDQLYYINSERWKE